MRSTRDDILAWLDAVAQRDPLRRMQAEFYFEQLAEFLRQLGGPPYGSIQEEGIRPATYWWDFYPDLWVRFCVEDQRSGWFGLFGERTRWITILQLADSPPIGPGP
jgi:hypothetical protein